MDYYGIYHENDYRYYLQHHGIKGQQWGVRNAEWYPIADYQAHLKNRAIKRIKINVSIKKSKEKEKR